MRTILQTISNDDNSLIQTDKQLDNNDVCAEVTETSTKKKYSKMDKESEEKALCSSNGRTRHSQKLRSCRIKNKNITKKHNDQLSFTRTKEKEKKSIEIESNVEISGNKRLSKLKETLNFDQFLDPSSDSSNDESYTDKGAESDNKTTGTSISTRRRKGTKNRKRYTKSSNTNTTGWSFY